MIDSWPEEVEIIESVPQSGRKFSWVENSSLQLEYGGNENRHQHGSHLIFAFLFYFHGLPPIGHCVKIKEEGWRIYQPKSYGNNPGHKKKQSIIWTNLGIARYKMIHKCSWNLTAKKDYLPWILLFTVIPHLLLSH